MTTTAARRIKHFLRTTPLLRPGSRAPLSIVGANLSEGLRAACAATAMLIVGHLLHQPSFGWAAIGAFWTCLADAAGSRERRLASMLGFSLLSTIMGVATALAAGLGTASAAVAVLLFCAIAGLASMVSAAVYQVAVLVATACVVMVAFPLRGLHETLSFSAIYLGGCLFATALSFTVWRIHPFAPARSAARLVYTRLGEFARDNAKLIMALHGGGTSWARQAAELRPSIRSAIESTQTCLSRIPPTRRDERGFYRALRLAVDDAESIFAYMVAVSSAAEHIAESLNTRERERAARTLRAVAEILLRIAAQVGTRPDISLIQWRSRLARLSTRLEKLVARELVFSAADDIAPPAAAPTGYAWPHAARLALGITLRATLDKLRADTAVRSNGIRHAIRLSIATTTTFLIVQAFALPSGYWATMATVLVLQPSVGMTWPRSIERAVGTIIGAALAAVIGSFLHTPLELAIAVFPLVCLTIGLRGISYGLYVTFLTPTFVLVADFVAPANEVMYSVIRLGDNILGVLIALLAAYLLWPKREADDLRPVVNEAVRANIAYLALALQHGGAVSAREQCESARRAACSASSKLERTYRLARLETFGTIDAAGDIAAIARLLRRIVGIAGQLRIASRDAPDPDAAAWARMVAERLCARNPDLAGSGGLPVPRASERSQLALSAIDVLTHLAQRVDQLHEAYPPAPRDRVGVL